MNFVRAMISMPWRIFLQAKRRALTLQRVSKRNFLYFTEPQDNVVIAAHARVMREAVAARLSDIATIKQKRHSQRR